MKMNDVIFFSFNYLEIVQCHDLFRSGEARAGDCAAPSGTAPLHLAEDLDDAEWAEHHQPQQRDAHGQVEDH